MDGTAVGVNSFRNTPKRVLNAVVGERLVLWARSVELTTSGGRMRANSRGRCSDSIGYLSGAGSLQDVIARRGRPRAKRIPFPSNLGTVLPCIRPTTNSSPGTVTTLDGKRSDSESEAVVQNCSVGRCSEESKHGGSRQTSSRARGAPRERRNFRRASSAARSAAKRQRSKSRARGNDGEPPAGRR